MAPSSNSKKRKREDSPERVTFKLAKTSQSVGPVLVSFPCLDAPPSTSFKCYADKKSKGDMLVVGETSNVEFVSNEEDSSSFGCHYLIALHDPKTSTLSVLPETKSPHILKRTVKALKSIPPAPAPSALEYRQARTNLGETFGTKKAKAAIRAQERNRVDVSVMQGVMQHVMDGIERGAEGLPTVEQAKETVDSNRLIPPYSTTATDVKDVYALHAIIPKAEWKAIDPPFDAITDSRTRKAWMPLGTVLLHWREAHLRSIGHQAKDKDKKTKLRILYYISAMMLFKRVSQRKAAERDEMNEKLKDIPSSIVDGLLDRFTETSRDSTAHQSTPAMETKLLTHMFALCLRLDQYATDPNLLAADLSLPVTKVAQLFKSLGCQYKQVTERERARLGLSDSYAKTKLCVLTAPVMFPKPRMGSKRK